MQNFTMDFESVLAPSDSIMSDVDFKINVNGKELYLFKCDWDGKIYTNSCDEFDYVFVNTGRQFEPVYEETFSGDLEIVGFLEV